MLGSEEEAAAKKQEKKKAKESSTEGGDEEPLQLDGTEAPEPLGSTVNVVLFFL